MPDLSTNPIPRSELQGLLVEEKRTVRMAPVQLAQLLLPERTTENIVVLLDRPKWLVHEAERRFALYCLAALVAFLIGFFAAR